MTCEAEDNVSISFIEKCSLELQQRNVASGSSLLTVRDVVPLSRHSHLPVISNSKTLQTKYLTKIFPVNREFSEPSLHQMYLHISGGRVGG